MFTNFVLILFYCAHLVHLVVVLQYIIIALCCSSPSHAKLKMTDGGSCR